MYPKPQTPSANQALMHPAARQAALGVTLLVASTMLSGCIFIGERQSTTDDLWSRQFRDPLYYPETPKPLEYTYFRIGQTQFSGPPPGVYEGTLLFENCFYNLNKFQVRVNRGYEVYQLLGPPNQGERRIVSQEKHNEDMVAGAGSGSGRWHDVYYNETLEGNSTDYTIHLWHQIATKDGPIHRQDRWFNVTFVPNAPESVSYEEGNDFCGLNR